jgi:hypothetical protein
MPKARAKHRAAEAIREATCLDSEFYVNLPLFATVAEVLHARE